MFVVFCPLHDCQVLLGPSRIRNLENLAPGLVRLEFECHDGQRLAVLTRKAPTSTGHPQSAERTRSPELDVP